MSEIKEDREITRIIKEELIKDKIDFSVSEYYCSPKYRKYRIKYLKNYGYGFISYDYYIEKVMLRDKNIKKGKYDIGTKCNLRRSDLKYDNLYWEIVNEEQEKYEQGKRDKPSTFGSVKSKFTENSSKGGLINQLKEILHNDLKKFDKLEKLKLLKLLYRFSKDNYYGQKINLMQMFKNPSMENIDKTILDEFNMNGEIIAILKGELKKEINLSKVIQMNSMLHKLTNAWENLLKIAGRYVVDNNVQDLERLAIFIEDKIVDKIPNIDNICSEYEYPLFESFYLKTLEYEYVCKESDFININKENLEKIHGNILKAKKYLEFDENKYIKESSLESEIKNQLNFFVVYTFAKNVDNINDFEKSFILDNRRNVGILINWLEKYISYELNEEIPCLLIVACYQALKDVIDNKEVFSYSYYRARVSGKIELISKVSIGDTSEEAFHWLWVKKIDFIYKCLLDRKDEAEYQIRIEKGFDTIMSSIMKYNNLQDIMDVHNFIFSTLKRSFILTKYAAQEANRVGNEVNRLSGYKIEIYHENVNNLFKDSWGIFDNSIINNFCQLIKQVENKKIESNLWIPMEGIRKSGEKRNSILNIEVDVNEKVIKLKQFYDVIKDEEHKKYEKLGLGKFIL